MFEKNIVLVPTALTSSLTELYIPIDDMPENITHKADLEKNNAIKTLKKAIKRHIYIASGSDAGIAIHGTNAKELHYYVEYGMTPLEALQSATIKAANALSSYELDGKKIGQLKAGYAADVIALKNNPLEQIDNLQTIDFVMKGGTIYKSPMGRC
ncbi:MAG: amidohydrolase family protein [Pseudomonadota bacterium]|nr:amidohydrolase family protein [Pseudomonadota bacterium]